MGTYPVTIDVADFVGNGPAPSLAFATIGRARIDTTTGEIITEAPISIRLTSTPQTVQLEQDVAYRVHLYGVAGLSGAFYALHDTACTLADLYGLYQVDPGTLQPAPVPATTQELLEQANEILTQVQSLAIVATADPNDDCLADLSFSASLLDPDDDCLVDLTIGAA